MGSHRVYRQRKFDFGQQLFDLRTRIALTQGQFADAIGVHWHSVQKWESGESYPKSETLQQLIAVCVRHAAFTPGDERDEALALWQRVSEDGSRRLPSFDEAWFARTLAQETQVGGTPADVAFSTGHDQASVEDDAPPLTVPASLPPTPITPRSIVDLGELIAVPNLVGREQELATLQQWVIEDRCRVVAIVGLGGIGKSSLTLIFGQRALDEFDVVLFRSLQNGPPLDSVLDHAITTVSAPKVIPPEQTTDKLALLVRLLRERRCLLILDNFESILQPGALTGTYRTGYADYGMLIEALSGREHRSCLMLTSREKPAELGQWESPLAPVRAMQLTGLTNAACHLILARKGISTTDHQVEALRTHYHGNPLALNLVAGPIRDLFWGDVASFLASGYAYFDGVNKLMEQHFARLTPLERTIVDWFALQRELMPLEALINKLDGTVQRRDVLGALESLIRRGQVERGADAPTFTLQPMILEFVTAQITDTLCQEILTTKPHLLESHAIIQASAKDYVRHRQEQLVATQLLEQLVTIGHGADAVEQLLLALLDLWRDRPQHAHGYGPGNAVNLLRLLRGNLRGLDLSRLTLREVYLQGIEMQDAQLTGVVMQDYVVSEAFGIVHTVTSTPSGSYWAASNINGAVRVSRNLGSEIHFDIPAHRKAVMALTFSPDEKLLATGSWDCTVKLWDLQSNTLMATLEGHTDYVQSVAFSPDGRQLVSGSDDQTLRIWDVASGACLRTIHAHTDNTYGVAWSPDGSWIVSCGFDCMLRIWDAFTGVCLKTLTGHTQAMTKVAISPDGQRLASGSFDHTVRIWDVASGECLQVFTGHSSTVTAIAWSPDGRTVASSSFDGTIRLWSVQHTTSERVLIGHGATVYSVAFTANGAMLLSGSDDQSFRVWDVTHGWCVRVFRVYGLFFFSVVWSQDGRYLLSANSDATLTVWNVVDGSVRFTLRGHTYSVYTAAWSPDGRWLASGGFDKSIYIWDVTTGDCVRVIQAHSDLIYRLVWSPDGQWLASTGRDQTVRVWSVTTATCRWVARGHEGPVNEVVWSPDGTQLASSSEDRTVRIWNAEDGTLRHTLGGHESAVAGVAWSPTGRQVASSGGGGTVGELLVWDADSGTMLRSIPGIPSVIFRVVWSRDGRFLIGGGSTGAIHWWDAESGIEIQRHQSHTGWVRSLNVSPDGLMLLSSGEDGVIHLWDIARAELIRKLRIDRPYERMDISGLRGVSEAAHYGLLALGAIET